jgi:energy-coupling factor transporter ATP-binding protein EcfA2
VSISDLSSGEKEYLYFYSYLRRIRADENKIILIDEPELHLHSSQIRKLCELIADLAVKNQVVIVTHSGEVLQHFISRANIILLSKGKVDRIQNADQMRKALEETGLPIDPSVFTAHWICAENEPTKPLTGGGPTTPEVLSWIFGNHLNKRYWSFGSSRASSKIYGEGIASASPGANKIHMTPLLDGDVLVKSPTDYFPATIPAPTNDLAHFPFWEIENLFLSDSIINAVILANQGVGGVDRFWVSVVAKQSNLLLSIKKTIAKNSLRRFSLDKYIDTDPQADVERWKTEIQTSVTDLSSIDAKFRQVIESKNWRWLPGKEALALAIDLEPSFWLKVRNLHHNKQLKALLESDAAIKTFIDSVSALSA